MTEKSSDSNLESFVSGLDATRKADALKESKSETSFAGNFLEIHEEKSKVATNLNNKSSSALSRLAFLVVVAAISGFILFFAATAIEGNKMQSIEALIKNSGLSSFFENLLSSKSQYSATSNN